MNISRIYSNDNLFLNETKQDACWLPPFWAATFTESSTSENVSSRCLEERVLRRGLELELQRRDVARGEVDACAQINR